jgi:hypothetical protein
MAPRGKDTDRDGVGDAQERRIGTSIRREDSDKDGLSDRVEILLGTNAKVADSDRDGIDDGAEVAFDLGSPRVRELDAQQRLAARVDGGRKPEDIERHLGVARNADTDGDGFADWVEEIRGTHRRWAGDLQPDMVENDSPGQRFLESALTQVGQAPAMDGGMLVQNAARHAGVDHLPASAQGLHQLLSGSAHAQPVAFALQTRGALLFGTTTDPLTGQSRMQVAISLGNGKVLDVNRNGVWEVMDPKPTYTHGSMVPELHPGDGDFDGDGQADMMEFLLRGDISKGEVDPVTAMSDDVVDPRGEVMAAAEPDADDPIAGLPAPVAEDPVDLAVPAPVDVQFAAVVPIHDEAPVDAEAVEFDAYGDLPSDTEFA